MSNSERLAPLATEHRGVATVAAIVGTVLIGARFDLAYGLTLGGVFALAVAPVWWRTLGRSRWSIALAVIVAACVASGYLLSLFHARDHSVVSSGLLTQSASLAQLVCVVGFLMWAFRTTSVANVAVAYGVGSVLGIPLNISGDPNLWRFTLSLPIAIFLLALVSVQDRTWVSVVALGGLAVVGLLNDSRSNSTFLLLTAVILIWQRIATTGTRRTRGWGGIIVLVVIAALLANLLQAAILDGYFGEVTRARTEAQIEQSGNVVFGGRPEIAASVALISRYPFGLGSGVVANYSDVQAAMQSMLGIGYDPRNRYVQDFMFGQSAEVHSVTGDLWIRFGLAGLALAVLCAALYVVSIKAGYTHGCLTALFVYLVLRGFWDLLFSPAASAFEFMGMTLALAIAYATFAVPDRRPGLTALIPKEPA